MPITDFDRYPLTFGPSPVHPLDRLTQHLGGRSRAASLRAAAWHAVCTRDGVAVPARVMARTRRTVASGRRSLA